MYDWKKIIRDMDKEEYEAITELLYSPENENVLIILSKYCYSLPELVGTAKAIYGLTYTGKKIEENSTDVKDIEEPSPQKP